MDGTFNFDQEGRATVVSAPAWSVDALRAIQGELEFLREKVSDSTLSDSTLYQIVEQTTRRILDHRDDKLTRAIVEGVEERLAADRGDRYKKKKRLRTATVWFLGIVLATLAQFALERGVEEIDFQKVWPVIKDAVDRASPKTP